jgi:hypothetical protein
MPRVARTVVPVWLERPDVRRVVEGRLGEGRERSHLQSSSDSKTLWELIWKSYRKLRFHAEFGPRHTLAGPPTYCVPMT